MFPESSISKSLEFLLYHDVSRIFLSEYVILKHNNDSNWFELVLNDNFHKDFTLL